MMKTRPPFVSTPYIDLFVMQANPASLSRQRAFQRFALVPIVLAAVLAAGCNKDNKEGGKATQAAARVNGDEITVHQINMVLERQPNIRPEQAEDASRQILEGLIDQELAVQKATEQKLDRDPQVVQMLEASRRAILARAYLDRAAQSAVGAPSADDVKKYFAEHPALFSNRRIYMLQDFTIQGDKAQIDALMPKLQATKTPAAFAETLKASGLKFNVNQVTQPAESLPLNLVDKFNNIQDGEGLYQPLNGGLKVILVAASKSQPIDEGQAKPLIERFLTESRRQEFIQKETRNMRKDAKVEYLGKFADKAPDAASAPAPAPTPASAASTASSGMDANTLSKGLSGLK